MGVPVTFLSPNSRSLLGSTITNLVPTETYLVVPWSEISSALQSGSSTPNTLEDWIAAINYTLVDRSLTDINPTTQQKLTASRRFITQINGKGLDNGNFESGVDLVGYQITTTIYTPDPSPVRPPATDL
ncbi:MAG: hypothetical protein IM504_23240 [Microcystis sp. M038S2]|jgi:hypothetical protein|uniref:hypothetical protein n=1 Tax=unclassified Microcystis TaxID=2643300 RepID=UPI001193DD8B|nr:MULTISPECIES: hypothetical protein [unclassified Microcystis]TRU59538.1 MAG: hypothetical protein EWV48_14570 [Microcystis aeruginosa Ma_QC_C_20070823_S13]TRU62235.1 MAG: hypothetical protein EWV56_07510 [Microcystis aeruginosa Ma_QC_C_20070823_S13D]MCA2685952.1 hypothetical protein [Microcystis sp. M046S2]MCA2707600.1 hypothetical protein [Microcystis sp. M038S2]MCA2948947.1 hypothetical protein [Microcystis sp. M109S1]